MKICLSTANLSLDNLSANTLALEESMRSAKKGGADLVLHGEASLSGFEALNFDYRRDLDYTLALQSMEIVRMQKLARDIGIAVGFGFYENEDGGFYSTYLIIDKEGEIIDLYHRVSPGWKIPSANADYRVGKTFHSFEYLGKTFATLVCGDLWEDDLLMSIIDLDPIVDAWLWPVHLDIPVEEWNKENKDYHDPYNVSRLAYSHRSAILEKPVLMINNYVQDEGRAKGGLYHWRLSSEIAAQAPGKPAQLFVEI